MTVTTRSRSHAPVDDNNKENVPPKSLTVTKATDSIVFEALPANHSPSSVIAPSPSVLLGVSIPPTQGVEALASLAPVPDPSLLDLDYALTGFEYPDIDQYPLCGVEEMSTTLSYAGCYLP